MQVVIVDVVAVVVVVVIVVTVVLVDVIAIAVVVVVIVAGAAFNVNIFIFFIVDVVTLVSSLLSLLTFMTELSLQLVVRIERLAPERDFVGSNPSHVKVVGFYLLLPSSLFLYLVSGVSLFEVQHYCGINFEPWKKAIEVNLS